MKTKHLIDHSNIAEVPTESMLERWQIKQLSWQRGEVFRVKLFSACHVDFNQHNKNSDGPQRITKKGDRVPCLKSPSKSRWTRYVVLLGYPHGAIGRHYL